MNYERLQVNISGANFITTDYRHFYQALLQQRVDIHYADQRIQHLLKQQKHVIRHIAYIKQHFSGQDRYQWHALEQLQIDSYLIK